MKEEEILIIINEVHKHSILYDTSHRDFKSNRKKDQVWEEVGSKMRMSGEEMKKRWKSLKDCYMKHLRSLTVRTGPKAKLLYRYKNWPWAEQMSIFKPFVQLTSTQPNDAHQDIENVIDDPLLIKTDDLFVSVEESPYNSDQFLDAASQEPAKCTRNLLMEIDNSASSTHQAFAGAANTFYELSPTQLGTTSTLLSRPGTDSNTRLEFLPSTSQIVQETDLSSNKHAAGRSSFRSHINRRRQNRISDGSSFKTSTDRVLDYLNKRKCSSSITNYNDIDLICLGYAKTIKKFSPSRQCLVKYKMAKLIMEQELEHNWESSPTSLCNHSSE